MAVFSREEEAWLLRRWQRGRDRLAQARLIEAHAGLVHAVVRAHQGPREDLLQQGYLGLLVALERFDRERQVRFGTYAIHWVRAFVMDYLLRNSGPVRLGSTRVERRLFWQLRRTERQLAVTGVRADPETLARALDVEREQVEAFLPRAHPHDLALQGTTAAGRLAEEELDAGGAGVEAVLADREEGLMRRRQVRAALREALDRRERLVITHRYLKHQPATLDALGRRLGVTRERVRQIEVKALDKLRARVADAM